MPVNSFKWKHHARECQGIVPGYIIAVIMVLLQMEVLGKVGLIQAVLSEAVVLMIAAGNAGQRIGICTKIQMSVSMPLTPVF